MRSSYTNVVKNVEINGIYELHVLNNDPGPESVLSNKPTLVSTLGTRGHLGLHQRIFPRIFEIVVLN